MDPRPEYQEALGEVRARMALDGGPRSGLTPALEPTKPAVSSGDVLCVTLPPVADAG